MQCPVQSRGNADLLLAYCARKLDPDTAAALERHMEQCAACRTLGEEQKAVWDALDLWEAMPVSPDFDRKLYARVEREGGGSLWARWFGTWAPVRWRPAVSVAAAGVLLVAAVLVEKPGPKAPAVETVEAEQIERTLEDLEMLRQLPVVPRPEAPRGPAM